MTYRQVAEMVSSIGVPYAYYQFPNNSGIAPPFVCFYFDSSNDFAADNTNYQRIRPLSIELYTDNKDFTLEQTLENGLNQNGLVYSREETYLDSERMYMVTFQTNIIITEG
jgi:hypothetical protein